MKYVFTRNYHNLKKVTHKKSGAHCLGCTVWLTEWWMHASVNEGIIGSGIWTNDGLSLILRLGTNWSKLFIRVQTFYWRNFIWIWRCKISTIFSILWCDNVKYSGKCEKSPIARVYCISIIEWDIMGPEMEVNTNHDNTFITSPRRQWLSIKWKKKK